MLERVHLLWRVKACLSWSVVSGVSLSGGRLDSRNFRGDDKPWLRPKWFPCPLRVRLDPVRGIRWPFGAIPVDLDLMDSFGDFPGESFTDTNRLEDFVAVRFLRASLLVQGRLHGWQVLACGAVGPAQARVARRKRFHTQGISG